MGLIGTKPAKGTVPLVVAYNPASGVLSKMPGLVEYLSAVFWEDGSPRQPATITLFVEDGMVKAALNDRASSRSAYVTADTVEACLKALESRLQSGAAEWRAWKRGK